jgi:site-specific DNA-adenine methylase
MTKSLSPVVGYPGGKRRLLKRLRALINVDEIERYVEPFVGMGANYLDLRSRGYEGPAVLADRNHDVREFWRLVHSDDSLLEAARDLASWDRTVDGYRRMMSEQASGVERVARFLWITNYAFGNCPPLYVGDRWSGKGTKLTSAEKWGKTFSWDDCVGRLERVVEVLRGRDVEVLNSAEEALSMTTPVDLVYADPPYRGMYDYNGRATGDFVMLVAAASGRRLLSEKADLTSELPGWTVHQGDVVARISNQTGAKGRRVEFIYESPPSIDLSVFAAQVDEAVFA